MITLARARLLAMALVATSACNQRRLTECQEFTSDIAGAGEAVMRHPLETASFETILIRVDREIATLNGIPELDHAKADYKTSMREAIQLATSASRAGTRSARIDGNATARAKATKATYDFIEATSLHCAGQR